MVRAHKRKTLIRKPYLGYYNPKRKKRSSARILRDILYLARGGEKKTHILFGTNVNPAILERYLELAVAAGLIRKTEKGYETTMKGIEYVENYDLFQSLLKSLESVERQIERLVA